MSERDFRSVKQWVDAWLSDNVHPTTYDPDGSEARELATLCLAHAGAEGISEEKIEKSVGDIVDYISVYIESIIDEQVARASAKSC